MRLDISNPDHEAALRWACENWDSLEYERDALFRQVYGGLDLSGEQCIAIRTISTPTLAADLIRQLVERAGGKVYAYGVLPGEPGRPYVTIATGDGESRVLFPMDQMVNAAARLLRLAPNAGPQAVLDALRGAHDEACAKTTTKGT